MTSVAVTMVRDEADIIASTVGQMLRQVDAVLVADNLSSDATRHIVEGLQLEHPGRVALVDDYEPAYRQSEKMSYLAECAHDLYDADWIVPFDADEWWYTPHAPTIGEALADVPARWHVVPAALYDHVATALDPDDGDPTRRLGWRRVHPVPLPKVAVRWRPGLVIEQGNHGAHYADMQPAHFDTILVVRHFPYRSAAQLVRKVANGAAAYRAAGDSQPAHNGAHWRQWGDLLDAHGEQAIADLFHTWYWRHDPSAELVIGDEVQPPLIFDPAP